MMTSKLFVSSLVLALLVLATECKVAKVDTLPTVEDHGQMQNPEGIVVAGIVAEEDTRLCIRCSAPCAARCCWWPIYNICIFNQATMLCTCGSQ